MRKNKRQLTAILGGILLLPGIVIASCPHQGDSFDSAYGQCNGVGGDSCTYWEATIPVYCQPLNNYQCVQNNSVATFDVWVRVPCCDCLAKRPSGGWIRD